MPFLNQKQVATLKVKTGSHTHVCKITLKLLLFSPWQNGVDFLSIAIKLMTAFSLSAKAHYNFLPNKEGKKWKTRRMDGDHQYIMGPNNFWIQIQIGVFNFYKAYVISRNIFSNFHLLYSIISRVAWYTVKCFVSVTNSWQKEQS